MSTPASAWDRAAALVVSPDGRRAAAVASLTANLPSPEALFEFMRDAEARFTSLKMRLASRSSTAAGDERQTIDVAIVHPGRARIATAWPDRGPARNYELWVSDGTTVRTFSGIHAVGTVRPARRTVEGTDGRDLPGRSRVYRPITALPADTLADAFIHPAGYCQNVLATGDCRTVGTDEVAGREVVLLTCAHPRTVEMAGDRPDAGVDVAVDRETGVILRQIERIGDRITRETVAEAFETNPSLPDALFELAFPSDARLIY